jgi:beta-xylosidase
LIATRARVTALVGAALMAVTGCGGSGGGKSPGASSGSGDRSAAGSGRAAPSGTYTNPVYDEDFPDPALIRVGTTYHAYATQGDGKNIQTLTSPDLVHWRPGDDALPELGSWADTGNTWAPEVIAVGRTYVMFYVARASEQGVQCIGRATSPDPAGPFVDRSTKPLVCQAALGGSIDANPIRAKDGALYLYWKNDGNCCGKPVHLWGQRLTADGSALTGKPVALLTNAKAWQGNLVEAPEMVAHGRAYVLFYSANNYASADYGLGYAGCRTPLGPCVDRSDASIIPSNDAAAGPGHCYVLSLPDGTTWMLYHAWPPDAIGSATPGRQLWMEPVTWRGDVPSVHPSEAGPQTAPR